MRELIEVHRLVVVRISQFHHPLQVRLSQVGRGLPGYYRIMNGQMDIKMGTDTYYTAGTHYYYYYYSHIPY